MEKEDFIIYSLGSAKTLELFFLSLLVTFLKEGEQHDQIRFFRKLILVIIGVRLGEERNWKQEFPLEGYFKCQCMRW